MSLKFPPIMESTVKMVEHQLISTPAIPSVCAQVDCMGKIVSHITNIHKLDYFIDIKFVNKFT